MGIIYANIELINYDDLVLFRKGFIKEREIKRLVVKSLVDTGAYMLSIPEHLKEQLGLVIVDEREIELADGHIEKVPVAGGIEIHFENRKALINGFVIGNEVLLGAIPMQELDVVINPKKETIEVNPENPFVPKYKMK